MSATLDNDVKLVCAIDQGTSSSRVLIFNVVDWSLVCLHQVPIQSFYPVEGWCEQNPMEILESVEASIDQAFQKLDDSDFRRDQVVAVGITNQRETTILWDKITGKPLHNAIVWLDNRTQDIVKEMISLHHKDVHLEKTGLPLSTYFSAFKFKWLLDNVESVRTAMDEDRLLFGNVDAWLMWNLTGGKHGGASHVTDVTNASRTMLMDLKTLDWDQGLCDFFGIKMSTLPKIKSSAEIYGHVNMDGCAIHGLPISGCLGDQQAALVGHKCFRPAMAKSTFGTGCFMLYNVGPKVVHSEKGLLSTVGYQMGPDKPPIYALEGSISIAGAAVSWLKQIGLIKTPTEIEMCAARVKDSGDVYFVPAFNGLFAPYWRSDARGLIIGLTQFSNRDHICRATLEALAFQVREILEAMESDSNLKLKKLLVDGGMTKNDLLMQIQADFLGISVERPEMVESTSLGAAFAAAVGIKAVAFNEADDSHTNVSLFSPKIESDHKEEKFRKWKSAVQRSLDWA